MQVNVKWKRAFAMKTVIINFSCRFGGVFLENFSKNCDCVPIKKPGKQNEKNFFQYRSLDFDLEIL